MWIWIQTIQAAYNYPNGLLLIQSVINLNLNIPTCDKKMIETSLFMISFTNSELTNLSDTISDRVSVLDP